MTEERDMFEKMIRSQLDDYEANVSPDVWTAIEAGLNKRKRKSVVLISFRRWCYYAAAAAVAALFVIYIQGDEETGIQGDKETTLAVVCNPASGLNEETRKQGNEETRGQGDEGTTLAVVCNPASGLNEETRKQGNEETRKQGNEETREQGNEETREESKKATKQQTNKQTTKQRNNLIANTRRWSFGMGGGSIGVGTNTVGMSSTADLYMSDVAATPEHNPISNNNPSSPSTHITTRPSQEILLNNYVKNRTSQNAKAHHKIPISTGIGVSYILNDRWSLNSGLTYTLLRSTWDYEITSETTGQDRQTLHFLGLPLSVSYRLAQWRKMMFYLSAGGMCEWNFAGKYKEIQYVNGDHLPKENDDRITVPLWSLNSRAGVTYPLWKFISIYAETGASYHFKYNSDIETIWSNKPFYVSLQAGIRFGF
ncbi:MAG: PorT family protein [Tannerella sp.]|jgi:hypothetical protein|nr:PorT family protein [Tannerella sp.]